jgi:hypothetical protein
VESGVTLGVRSRGVVRVRGRVAGIGGREDISERSPQTTLCPAEEEREFVACIRSNAIVDGKKLFSAIREDAFAPKNIFTWPSLTKSLQFSCIHFSVGEISPSHKQPQLTNNAPLVRCFPRPLPGDRYCANSVRVADDSPKAADSLLRTGHLPSIRIRVTNFRGAQYSRSLGL